MAGHQVDIVGEFKKYIARFDEASGKHAEFGEFVKHNGRLVKKLRFDEFEPLYKEYLEVAKAYFDSIDRGDTINDVMVKLVRDRATDLIKTSPV